jgi:hypothetical protein
MSPGTPGLPPAGAAGYPYGNTTKHPAEARS